MNIGLIGYGFMGGAHLAAIAAIPGVTLKAVASQTRPAANGPTRGNMDLQAGPLPPDVAWYADWRTIVSDPAIDVVDICLPTYLHKQVILSAFERGKHVLCEKPMALTPEDCDELLEAADKVNCIFMVAQVLRFMSAYRHAASFVRADRPLRGCLLRRVTGYPQWSPWLADTARSGGAVLDLLSHDLDQALSWFGAPATVSAVHWCQVDTARATLFYPDGLRVTVEGGWLAADAPFAQSFELKADNASLTFADGKLHRTHVGVAEEILLPEEDPYAEEIAYFLACCRSGRASSLCPPVASANAVRLADLVRRSREQDGKEIAWT